MDEWQQRTFLDGNSGLWWSIREVALHGLHFTGVSWLQLWRYKNRALYIKLVLTFICFFFPNDIFDILAHSEIWKMENQVYQHYPTRSNPIPLLLILSHLSSTAKDWLFGQRKKRIKETLKLQLHFQHQDLALTSNAVAGASFWQWLPQPCFLAQHSTWAPRRAAAPCASQGAHLPAPRALPNLPSAW